MPGSCTRRLYTLGLAPGTKQTGIRYVLETGRCRIVTQTDGYPLPGLAGQDLWTPVRPGACFPWSEACFVDLVGLAGPPLTRTCQPGQAGAWSRRSQARWWVLDGMVGPVLMHHACVTLVCAWCLVLGAPGCGAGQAWVGVGCRLALVGGLVICMVWGV